MTFKVLGTCNDRDECECCGKTNLKMVVVLARLDADKNPIETVYYGRDCAARATKLRRTGAAMEVLAQEAQRAAERAERNRIHLVGDERSVKAWVVESVSSMGDSSTLCFANGLKSAVVPWAEQRYPNLCVNVRLAY